MDYTISMITNDQKFCTLMANTGIRHIFNWLIALCFVFLCTHNTSIAAETINVGIKQVPPFAMQNEQGNWSGISVDLWQKIAQQMQWKTKWITFNSAVAQIEGLSSGKIDIALGALSMTPDRETLIDFSYPFYTSGLAIATTTQESHWLMMLAQLISPTFLGAISILFLVLLVVGVLLWLVEHKRNPKQFGGPMINGIGNGFWWSAVTMTTVGYGDKTPITLFGRVVATIWMFVSVITISGFTAGIASSFTIQQMVTKVQGISDLNDVRTITIKGSSSEQFLHKMQIPAKMVAQPSEALTLLQNGEADAFVYDEPLLRYLLKDSMDNGIEILPQTIAQEDYAFGLKADSIHREPLNRSLLTQMQGKEWSQIIMRYLGK